MKGIRKKVITAMVLAAGACLLGGLAACSSPMKVLAEPQNLRMESEILYWDEVEGAVGYRVNISGSDIDVTAPCLDTFELLDTPGTYVMNVIAQGDYEKTVDSEPSAELTYTVTFGGVLIAEYEDGYQLQADPSDPPKGKLVIPEMIYDKPIKKIATGGFQECTELTSLILPNHIVELGNQVFQGCSNLERIKLPEDLEKIPQGIFLSCVSLWDCAIPNGVKSIDSYAFADCSSLKELKLPESVAELGTLPWRSNRLEHIEVDAANQTYYSEGNCLISRKDHTLIVGCAKSEIPGSVVAVGYRAFADVGLTEMIEIPSNVKTIEDSAFAGNSFTSFILPKTVTSFGPGVFSKCGITSVAVEEGNPVYYSKGNCILTREGMVVMGCDTSEIPQEATGIGESAFSYCKELTKISIPAGVWEIGKFAFDGCEELTKISIPAGVKELGYYTFANCKNLKEVILANGLEKIGNFAFENCFQLTNITIPKSVVEVSSSAFSYCPLTVYIDQDSALLGNADISFLSRVVRGCEIVYDEEQYAYAVSIAGNSSSLNRTSLVAPSRAGYLFAGWATEQGGEVVFPAKIEYKIFGYGDVKVKTEILVTDYEYSDRKDVTLYAVWIPKE